jgi:hypothetical protein
MGCTTQNQDSLHQAEENRVPFEGPPAGYQTDLDYCQRAMLLGIIGILVLQNDRRSRKGGRMGEKAD